MSAIFIVILASVINLSLGTGISELWSSLLAGGLGYILPNPKLTKAKPPNNNQIFQEAAEALHDVATFLPESAV